jgi:SH3-like domain-containing protein
LACPKTPDGQDRMNRIWVVLALAMLATGLGGAGHAQEAAGPVIDTAAVAPDLLPDKGSVKDRPRDPSRGAVTNLPMPRYVTLKGSEGNARRGPSLTHRIDWTFTLSGMPLKITAEHENWRRVEDGDGVGGWVHYALLSGTRSVLVTEDMAEFRSAPESGANVVLQAEYGVVAKLMECRAEWCRVSADGTRGWVRKTSIWGVEPGEIID